MNNAKYKTQIETYYLIFLSSQAAHVKTCMATKQKQVLVYTYKST